MKIHFRRRRGGLLIEVILAMAIFIIAGGAILNLVSQTMTGLERSRAAARAADLARSAMAQIEAGIETPQTLNGPLERQAETTGQAAWKDGWEYEIDTEPSQFRGLTRVQVRALKRAEDRIEAEYELVQLVRLGSKGEDRPGDEDLLTERARQGLSRETPARPSAPTRPGGAP